MDRNSENLSGKKTGEEAVSEFLNQFAWTECGKLTKAEFVSFYEDLSLAISSEQLFTEKVLSQWGAIENSNDR